MGRLRLYWFLCLLIVPILATAADHVNLNELPDANNLDVWTGEFLKSRNVVFHYQRHRTFVDPSVSPGDPFALLAPALTDAASIVQVKILDIGREKARGDNGQRGEPLVAKVVFSDGTEKVFRLKITEADPYRLNSEGKAREVTIRGVHQENSGNRVDELKIIVTLADLDATPLAVIQIIASSLLRRTTGAPRGVVAYIDFVGEMNPSCQSLLK